MDRVARRSGLSATRLRAIESGRARPSLAILDRIARALGSTLVDLVIGPEDAPPPNLGLTDIALAVVALPLPGRSGSKLDAVEAATVLVALRACNDNQSAAARLLGMERKAFVRRLSHARRSGVRLDPASLTRRAE